MEHFLKLYCFFVVVACATKKNAECVIFFMIEKSKIPLQQQHRHQKIQIYLTLPFSFMNIEFYIKHFCVCLFVIVPSTEDVCYI